MIYAKMTIRCGRDAGTRRPSVQSISGGVSLRAAPCRRRRGAWGSSPRDAEGKPGSRRSEEHTSELQSLMRISYAVFCLKKKKNHKHELKTIIRHLTQLDYKTQLEQLAAKTKLIRSKH